MKKTAKIIIGLLLAALGLPASAQRAQDALYIFRNDGQFNAFFWGDIQRFAYSKVDTLGVEHDDYVVQEVYALDSVFRIPVSAIDSIAFVTPENKVKNFAVTCMPDGYEIVDLKDVDSTRIVEFFEHQPEDAFIFFKPPSQSISVV